MKKKTLFFVALVLSIVILVMNIIVCSIYLNKKTVFIWWG